MFNAIIIYNNVRIMIKGNNNNRTLSVAKMCIQRTLLLTLYDLCVT